MAENEETSDEEQAPEGEAAEAAPEAGAAAPAAGVGADLLNMFESTQVEVEDRSAVLELAGDVELDDLLEELATVASALGLKASA